ncbi:mitochondrial import inner membrane translocase subunit Tim13-like [Dromiciops gliroides]|uniref:mitochondrial import inner membrane translocase subunit Tim13-like n=1 Tax=Dromiciops gliroides TaxID=33562 RepID=UPI001CC7EADC|nr:mitochondrial import inner membrane translocase subunit Tim13-like [Dromiciops gliroides]
MELIDIVMVVETMGFDHFGRAIEGSFGSDLGGGAGAGGGKLDPGLIMEQVKVQIAVANARELPNKCLRKCIENPSCSLDNSKQKCIAVYMDRFMDPWNTVSRAYNSRLQRERANM